MQDCRFAFDLASRDAIWGAAEHMAAGAEPFKKPPFKGPSAHNWVPPPPPHRARVLHAGRLRAPVFRRLGTAAGKLRSSEAYKARRQCTAFCSATRGAKNAGAWSWERNDGSAKAYCCHVIWLHFYDASIEDTTSRKLRSSMDQWRDKAHVRVCILQEDDLPEGSKRPADGPAGQGESAAVNSAAQDVREAGADSAEDAISEHRQQQWQQEGGAPGQPLQR